MTILNLNQFAISIAPGSLKRAWEEVGPKTVGYKGWGRDAVRARRRVWTAAVVLGVAANQEAVEQLLLGRGSHFPFDTSLYSDRTGLGPSSGYSVVLATSAPAPKFGAYRLQVNSGTTISWVCDVPLTNTWSMVWWFSTGGAWDHWVVVSTAGVVTAYKNGALIAAPSNYSVSVSGTTGTFSLLGKTTAGVNSATAYFDDLVIFPTMAMQTGMITAFAAATSAQSALPYLNLTGDLLQETVNVEVRGEITNVAFLDGQPSTGWANNMRIVEFKLTESQPYR